MSFDPAVFRPEAIDPETAAINDQIAMAIAAGVPFHQREPAAIRAEMDVAGPLGPVTRDPDAQDRTIRGPTGEIPIRVLLPESQPRGVYLHFHGGGFMLGKPFHSDAPNREITKEVGVAVVSVNYRLAPEHKYPAGWDDCEAAARWLVANARAEFGTDALLIGGGSAGAQLSANVLLRMRDRHGYTGWRGANLVYGAYFIGSPSQRAAANDPIIPTATIDWFQENMLAGPVDVLAPDLSALFADLRGLPPALFTVGTRDPLLDDSMFMYARWIAAGNKADLRIYPGGIHGFDQLPINIAKTARAKMHEFLRESLAEPAA